MWDTEAHYIGICIYCNGQIITPYDEVIIYEQAGQFAHEPCHDAEWVKAMMNEGLV